MAKLGHDFKLYYGSVVLTAALPGAYAGTWTEITNVKDVTTSVQRGEADISTRASTWKQSMATLIDGGVEFEMIWNTSDAAFGKIRDAFIGNNAVALAVMDGDIHTNASEGLVANMMVSQFTRKEPLEGAATVSVKAKPTSYASWYEVSGS